MSRRRKLEKFLDNQASWNVIEPGKNLYHEIKGNWKMLFNNERNVVLELACGQGEYTIGLAEKFPNQNFIGTDIKGDRIWKGSQYALAKQLKNVAFLRVNIYFLPDFFSENEVDEIWLIFPDPWLKDRDEKHRLSNATYLRKYQQILKKDGWFKFKTDNTFLFEYTLQTLTEFLVRDHIFTFDLYDSPLIEDHFGIQTRYEKIWIEKGHKIKYMKFRF